MSDFEIEGLAALQDKFRRLPNGTRKAILRRVGRKALQPIAVKARSLAPRLTGRLRKSIKVGGRLSRHQYLLYGNKTGGVEMYVGPGPLPYAHMIEFGTDKIKAQPYMRPAWDACRVQAMQDIKNLMWDEVEAAL